MLKNFGPGAPDPHHTAVPTWGTSRQIVHTYCTFRALLRTVVVLWEPLGRAMFVATMTKISVDGTVLELQGDVLSVLD